VVCDTGVVIRELDTQRRTSRFPLDFPLPDLGVCFVRSVVDADKPITGKVSTPKLNTIQ
jgi:hypothetical protein